MRNAIFFIGREFLIGEGFVEYAKQETKKKLLFIDTIRFLSEKSSDLFLEISQAYEKYDNLLIFAIPPSYPTVSKIVATIFEDSLIVKEKNLIPSKAIQFTHDSFVIGQEHKINVLKATQTKELPSILISPKIESTNLFVINSTSQELHSLLRPLAERLEVDYILTPLTQEFFKVSIFNKPFGNIVQFIQEAKELLQCKLIIAYDIFEYLIDKLSIAQKKITFAESCTGGLLASMLTKVPGSSTIFDGSFVTYSNDMKKHWLGVQEETLKKFGAVSEETVEEMLQGAHACTKANYAIAISGIAGPGGARPNKPVGTVVVGCSSEKNQIIRTRHFQGDRNYIQYQSAMYGIKLLLEIAHEDLF